MLVDPVVEQARQAEVLLKNRRAFVERMHEEGEGDVMPTPRDRRVLTEAEVDGRAEAVARTRAGSRLAKLYRYARPLAAVMDRFVVDDERYLGEEDVTDEQLDEIEQSCDLLGEALCARAAPARPRQAGLAAPSRRVSYAVRRSARPVSTRYSSTIASVSVAQYARRSAKSVSRSSAESSALRAALEADGRGAALVDAEPVVAERVDEAASWRADPQAAG